MSSSCEIEGFGIRVARVISLLAVRFPVLILGNSGMLLMSQDNQLLGKLIIFENLPAFWKLMEWIEKAFRAKAASNGSFYVKCWVFFYGFGHNFFVLSPFWAHEQSN